MRESFLIQVQRAALWTILLGLGALASLPARAGEGGARADGRLLRFISTPSDRPDPYDPFKGLSALTASLAVRPTDDLEALAHSERARRAWQFDCLVEWTLQNGSGIVARVNADRILTVPFQTIELPGPDGHGHQRYIRVTVTVPWNGRTTDGSGRALPDGAYPYTVRAELFRTKLASDAGRAVQRRTLLGVAGPTSGTLTLLGTPPILTLSAPRNGAITRSTSVAVSGTVTGIPVVTVAVDGAPVRVAAGAYQTTASLVEGPNTVAVVATDGAGRQSSASAAVFRDTVPPVVTILSPSPGALLRSGAGLRLAASFTDAAPSSGIDVSSFQALLDGQDVSSACTVTTTGAVYAPASTLGDGSHTFAVSIADRAGNRSGAWVACSIDSVAPAVSILSPAGGSTVTTDAPSMSASYQDPTPGSGVIASTFRASLDGASITSAFSVTATGAFAAAPPGGHLASGQHTLVVWVQDAAGNTGQAESSFTVAVPPPPSPSPSPSSSPSPSPSSSSSPPPSGTTGTVSGLVFTADPCGGAPVAGATVSIAGTGTTTTTDATGRYLLQANSGVATLNVSKIAFFGVQTSASVSAGQSTTAATVYLPHDQGDPCLGP